MLCPVRALRLAPALMAFVGEKTASAAEYHCNDFDWEDLRAEGEAQQQTPREGPPPRPWSYDPASWERCAPRVAVVLIFGIGQRCASGTPWRAMQVPCARQRDSPLL